MGRVVLVLLFATLITGAAQSAAREPAETRGQMIRELQAAIEDEKEALTLSRRKPPRYEGAALRLRRASSRLTDVADAVSEATLPPSVETGLRQVAFDDHIAALGVVSGIWTGTEIFEKQVSAALAKKSRLLEQIRTAAAPSGTPQCSDGKDNDGDGVTDWTDEPGCTSARDLRESSPLSCVIDSTIAGSRLVLSGSCSGSFSELDVTLLDGVKLNGTYDIQHAPSCSETRPDGFRCSTKNAAQNPGHKVSLRLTTTSTDRRQRVALRFLNKRKRPVLRVVLPPL